MAVAAAVSILDPWITVFCPRRFATVLIRPLRQDDREQDTAYLQGLSRQGTTFVATAEQDGVEQLVGVASYGVCDELGTAEFAVSVPDAWQRCGIATALMKELVRYASQQRIRRLIGRIPPDNHAMVALARRLGFTVRYDPAQHVFFSTCTLNGAETKE